MDITFFHKQNFSYSTKIIKNAKVRIYDKVKLSDASVESDKSAVIRIFTKQRLPIYPGDRCVFYKTDSILPPGGSFVVKNVCDNTRGILSHIRIDCVC